MSKAQVEALLKTVETLLQEAEQTKAGCRRQAEEAKQAVEGLRGENQELSQRCAQIEQQMEEMKKTVGELLDTKVAFEARERQVRKLSKQL